MLQPVDESLRRSQALRPLSPAVGGTTAIPAPLCSTTLQAGDAAYSRASPAAATPRPASRLRPVDGLRASVGRRFELVMRSTLDGHRHATTTL